MGYTESQAKAFISYIAPIIQIESRARGYKVCSTVIAQAIIEGACGTSSLAKNYHNHFGMKCGSSWKGKSVNMKTKEEYITGTLVTIKDNFRAYDNDRDGVKGYYDFISTNRYANLKNATTYRQYADMLKQDGYATSSTYVNSLCKTVEKYGLTVYDKEESQNIIVQPTYSVGKTYTTTVNLFVRVSPRGDKKKFSELSVNAKKNGFADNNGDGILKRNTKITCKGVQTTNGQIWIQIPSGWICAVNSGNEVYVE